MNYHSSKYHIPERFLRQIWKYRQFSSPGLATTDSQPIEIHSVGKLNTDSGPDFIGACLRIGGTLYRGDIELHECESEWFSHGHHTDPKYNGVILHVVIDALPDSPGSQSESRRRIPVLSLKPYLVAGHRSTWNMMILGERAERKRTIRCEAYTRDIGAPLIHGWLVKLAHERLEFKVQRYEERIRELSEKHRIVISEPPREYDEIPFGLNPDQIPPPSPPNPLLDYGSVHLWLQLLYEGIMEALGYSKNQRPFQKLAQNVPLKFVEEVIRGLPAEETTMTTEALLFGIAGLLPPEQLLPDPGENSYLRSLRTRWTELRPVCHCEIIHPSEWQFFRLRPENFPTIRIAGAARIIRLLLQADFFRSLIQQIKMVSETDEPFVSGIETMFNIPADGYWSSHFRFCEASEIPVRRLIGRQRAREIFLNVLIPVFCLYARLFKDRTVRNKTLELFDNYPPTQGNTIVRIIQEQLAKESLHLDTAALQQGAIQLYKFYCCGDRCADCAVGRRAGIE